MFQFSKFNRNHHPGQLIESYKKKRYFDVLQERSQGFWLEDQVKSHLDRIRFRSQKMKTEVLSPSQSHNQLLQSAKKRRSTLRRPKKLSFSAGNYQQNYLPQLNELIEYRQTNDFKLIRQKRWNILHLVIFAINRKNLGKLYESLDLLLLASTYFERDDKETRLKNICIQLIGKIHNEIKYRTEKAMVIQQNKKNSKKRKSLLVQSIMSRQTFMINFVEKLRRTKLIFESTYQRQAIKNELTPLRRKDSNEKHQKVKINGKYEIYIPEPAQIFCDSLERSFQGIKQEQKSTENYSFVVVLIDESNNRFPYEYPKILSGHIEEKQYRLILSKLNGILLPEARCYSWDSIIKIFYLPIFMIFLLFMLFTVINREVSSYSLFRGLNIALFCIFIALFALKIKLGKLSYSNFHEISDQLKKYLFKLGKEYEHCQLKFILNEDANGIIIVFPSELSDISESSKTLTSIQQVDENTYSRQNSNINYYSMEQSLGSTQNQAQDGSTSHEGLFITFKDPSMARKNKISRFSRLKNLEKQKKEDIQMEDEAIDETYQRPQNMSLNLQDLFQTLEEISNKGITYDIEESELDVPDGLSQLYSPTYQS